MCSPDGIMRSILIIVAGLASASQLMSCDCVEELFKNSGLDLKMDSWAYFFSGKIRIITLSRNQCTL